MSGGVQDSRLAQRVVTSALPAVVDGVAPQGLASGGGPGRLPSPLWPTMPLPVVEHAPRVL